MPRTARCCCGALSLEADGEPIAVIACHCQECQRRTGAPFGVGAYFDDGRIRATGPSRVYERDGQEGRKIRTHFCPNCGTSLYWRLDLWPSRVGVALGTFADPDFPAPVRSVWEETRHRWVAFAHEPQRFERQSAVQPPQE